MLKRLVLLPDLRLASDWAVLALRLFVGAFLVWGVWDNITSSARMDEFAKFLRHHGFAAPALMARLSVWAQFACGIAFVAGACTRWAGLVCAFNFIVALWMVDAQNGACRVSRGHAGPVRLADGDLRAREALAR